MVAMDQRVREVLVSADELEAVALEQRGLCATGPQRLALEHEIGDVAYELLDGRERLTVQGESCHVVSVYRHGQ
jgi:hypothetical protein